MFQFCTFYNLMYRKKISLDSILFLRIYVFHGNVYVICACGLLAL